MSLVDGSQTAYGLQEKPHDRGRSPPGPEDKYTSGAAISFTSTVMGNSGVFRGHGAMPPPLTKP